MSQAKKVTRRDFNARCLRRDGGKCRLCGVAAGAPYDPMRHAMTGPAVLTAHHITDRTLMPNGGYVASNGITLCESCHVDVEDVAHNDRDVPPERWAECQASNLYKLIGSSYATALADAERGTTKKG